MDWDDLRTFLAIARHRTLTGAARALGVTQPTMGRRLTALEERVGARLLVKMPGGYAITSLGDMILANVERIEREILAADRIVRGADVSIGGHVRLTAVGSTTSDIVTPALGALHRRHPEISVDIVADYRNLSLPRREADLALRFGRFDSKDIHSICVARIEFGIYGTPDWAQRIAEGDSRIITVLEDQDYLPEAVWLRGLFPDAPVSFRSNSREVLQASALAGAGLAPLVRFRGDATPGLVRYCLDKPRLHRELWLGVHEDMRDTPRLKLVIDALTAAFAEAAPILNPDRL